MKRVMLFIAAVSILSLGQGEAMAIMPDEVSVDGQAVVMPVGRLLLVGKDSFVGAVKFLHNEERKEGVYSKYESFEYENGAFRKIREGVISRKIPPREKWWYKLRTFLFHDIPSSFADKLTFKSFELYAIAADEFHSTVCFWDKAAKPDVNVRLAPTPWKEISEVNLKDQKLRWFMHDNNRQRMVVHIDKLWD
jgi:hypothetical protein